MTPNIVYVIQHHKPEKVTDQGAIRLVSPAGVEMGLAAIADLGRARYEAERWAKTSGYEDLEWEEFTNPLLGHAPNLRGTANVNGEKIRVFEIIAMELLLGAAPMQR